MTHTAYIAFGSNLANPLQQVKSALKSLETLGTVEQVSPLYQSKAIGPGEQGDYINGCLKLKTKLPPYELLDALQAIEAKQGRVRSVQNAARPLDLDILLFDQLSQKDPKLTLPHPRMHERNFVIFPLQDIAPQLQLPNGIHLSTVSEKLNWDGLKPLDIRK